MKTNDFEFQKIYAEFQPKILRYLTRLVNEHEAEDLTQEVMVRVSQRLGSFRGEAQLSTWIYRIATNAAIDLLRSSSFQQEAQQDALEEDEAIANEAFGTEEEKLSLEQICMHTEMVECFENFLRKLPLPQKTVFVLSDLDGFSNRDIAEVLGISLESVKIRLHRGRRQLLQELKAHCKAEDWL